MLVLFRYIVKAGINVCFAAFGLLVDIEKQRGNNRSG